MREIISLHGGQCGVQLGSKFWKVISDEHGIQPNCQWAGVSSLQEERLGVYFRETDEKEKYKARAILFDLDRSVVNQATAESYGKLFSSEMSVVGVSGANNNWAIGYHQEGMAISENVLNRCRKLAEECESLQGFQLMNSLGGGSGSGVGCRVLNSLKEEYPDKIKMSYNILPSPEVSNTVLEPYNTVLSLQHLIESADASVVIDNQALSSICSTLGVKNPGFSHMNHLISAALSGTTASIRFPGQLNTDLRKMCTNLSPFPRLHFFVVAFAPLNKTPQEQRNVTISEITTQLFSPSNYYCQITEKGKFFTATALYRGNCAMKQVEESLALAQTNSSGFVNSIPDNLSTSVCDIPPLGLRLCGTLMGNHTSVGDTFNRISQQQDLLFKRRAFLHWYYDEGVSELDITEAQGNITDLCMEYKSHEVGFEDRPDDCASMTDSYPSVNSTKSINDPWSASINPRSTRGITHMESQHSHRSTGYGQENSGITDTNRWSSTGSNRSRSAALSSSGNFSKTRSNRSMEKYGSHSNNYSQTLKSDRSFGSGSNVSSRRGYESSDRYKSSIIGGSTSNSKTNNSINSSHGFTNSYKSDISKSKSRAFSDSGSYLRSAEKTKSSILDSDRMSNNAYGSRQKSPSEIRSRSRYNLSSGGSYASRNSSPSYSDKLSSRSTTSKRNKNNNSQSADSITELSRNSNLNSVASSSKSRSKNDSYLSNKLTSSIGSSAYRYDDDVNSVSQFSGSNWSVDKNSNLDSQKKSFSNIYVSSVDSSNNSVAAGSAYSKSRSGFNESLGSSNFGSSRYSVN